MLHIPLKEVRKENCPECHAQCGWCAGNVIMMRECGCVSINPKYKCAHGEARKGIACSICDGSGTVQVKREIIRAVQGKDGERK